MICLNFGIFFQINLDFGGNIWDFLGEFLHIVVIEIFLEFFGNSLEIL